MVELIWGWTVGSVKRAANTAGSTVLPRRWVVEPGAPWAGFAWFGRYRILRQDDEQVPNSSEAMVPIVMIQVMLKRLDAP